jgi:hypothetical protein
LGRRRMHPAGWPPGPSAWPEGASLAGLSSYPKEASQRTGYLERSPQQPLAALAIEAPHGAVAVAGRWGSLRTSSTRAPDGHAWHACRPSGGSFPKSRYRPLRVRDFPSMHPGDQNNESGKSQNVERAQDQQPRCEAPRPPKVGLLLVLRCFLILCFWCACEVLRHSAAIRHGGEKNYAFPPYSPRLTSTRITG